MKTAYRNEPITPLEAWMMGLKRRARRQHCLADAYFPVELTALDAARRRYSRVVRPVTLQPFLVKAVALAVRATPGANRILFRRFPFGRRIVGFRDVDVSVPVTRAVDGKTVTFMATVRSADSKSVGRIQDELSAMQSAAPHASPHLETLRRLEQAPRVVASVYHWLMSHSPAFYLRNAGTCGITTLPGPAGSHFFPVGPSTAVFGVGGIGEQVVARDGAPVVRRMLDATLTIDNHVLGGPAGHALAHAFRELVESCSFVEDELSGVDAGGPPDHRQEESRHASR